MQITGTSGNDQFVIRLDPSNSSNIQISDNGGSSFQTAALSDVTSITIQPSAGNDVLTIDNSNGLVAKSGGLPITFNGGPGIDVLQVTGNPGGGSSMTETFTPGVSARAGTLTIGNGTVSNSITLTDVSAVVDTLTAGNLTINVNNNNNVIDVTSGPTINGQKTILVRGVVAGELDETLDDRRDDNERLGDDQGKGDDEHDHEQLRTMDDVGEASEGFLPILFANKTKVTITATGGEHLFIVNLPNDVGVLQTLTINGGSGLSVLAERNLPASVTLSTTNIQRVDTNAKAILIDKLFAERLDREAGEDELNNFLIAFDEGFSQAELARIIEESPEGRTVFVKQWYKHFLGRDASNGEEQGWVHALLNGVSEEQLLSMFLNTEEFFEHAQSLFNNGNANENFVRALYQLLLNRDASSEEVQEWLNAMPSMGRQGIALGFLFSEEFREETIGAFFNFLLHRHASSDEINAWANSGMNMQEIREGIEASSEFAETS